MFQKRLKTIIFILGLSTMTSCYQTPPTLPAEGEAGLTAVEDSDIDSPTEDPILPTLEMEAITRCQGDEDCIIVLPACCGNYTAIHKSYLEEWNIYQEALKETCPTIACEPLLPIDSFAARCIEGVCTLRDASCELEIEDPQEYLGLIRQHPAISQLQEALNLLDAQLPEPCVMAGKVRFDLRFEIPSGFSAYGAVYSADLRLWYHLEEGTIEPAYDPISDPVAGPAVVEPGLVLDYFIERIWEIEHDSRVVEMFKQLGWNAAMGRVYLSSSPMMVQFHKGSIEYAYPWSSPKGGVYRYVVPNGLDWQSFPELEQAHKIIREQLLLGEWSHCSISEGEWAYSNTVGYRWYDNPDPWWLEADLDCGGEWRVAGVKINADGSYEQLEVR